MAFENLVERPGVQFNDIGPWKAAPSHSGIVIRVIRHNPAKLAVIDPKAESFALVADDGVIENAPSSPFSSAKNRRIGLDTDAAPAKPFFQHVCVAVREAVRGGKNPERNPVAPGQHLMDDPPVLPLLPP